MNRFVRRRVGILPKIGEIFSATRGGGGSPHGPGDRGPDEDDPNGAGQIHGIMTEEGSSSDGNPILTEDGQWIQAENQ